MNEKTIKVVLSGAGLLYPLHAGALHYLADAGYTIEHITGVSGGAIVAACVASGYAPGEQLNDLLLDTLPGPLVDWSWKPWCDWGLIKGEKALRAMREVMVPRLGQAEVPCNIGTVNLDAPSEQGGRHVIYSTEHTPEVGLAEAVRASISLPFIFRPSRINGQRHIDGGVASNFPLDIYGTGEDVLGFQIRPLAAPSAPTTFREYAVTVLDIMMDSIAREHIDDAMFARTVSLRGQGALNFDMTHVEARELLRAGYKQAQQALEAM